MTRCVSPLRQNNTNEIFQFPLWNVNLAVQMNFALDTVDPEYMKPGRNDTSAPHRFKNHSG